MSTRLQRGRRRLKAREQHEVFGAIGEVVGEAMFAPRSHPVGRVRDRYGWAFLLPMLAPLVKRRVEKVQEEGAQGLIPNPMEDIAAIGETFQQPTSFMAPGQQGQGGGLMSMFAPRAAPAAPTTVPAVPGPPAGTLPSPPSSPGTAGDFEAWMAAHKGR